MTRFSSIAVAPDWTSALSPATRPQLEALLVEWLRGQRWFGGKARTVTGASIQESIPIDCGPDTAFFNLVRVNYLQGGADWYAVPLAFARGQEAGSLCALAPGSVLCELTLPGAGQSGVLHGAVTNPAFCRSLLELISSGGRIKSATGELEASRLPLFGRILGGAALPEPKPAKAEQSNSSVIYGDELILKLFRRLELGTNPELELTRFLTTREFVHAQQLAGALEFCRPDGERITLGVLNRFLPGARDAWTATLEEVDLYCQRVARLTAERRRAPPGGGPGPIALELPPLHRELLGAYFGFARRLAERTAEMHLALASDREDPAFAPEPFSPERSRELFDSMHHEAARSFGLLRNQLSSLPADLLPLARRVLQLEPDVIRRFRRLYERPLSAWLIRCHGDYHLGQVLYVGGDFVIIDFEGEPALPLPERRAKRSPLRDVAGMVRSFDYAARAGLQEHLRRTGLGPECSATFEPWLRWRYRAVSSVFLRAYRQTLGESAILPCGDEEFSAMLPAYLLHKGVYEIGYELNNRQAWLRIPLLGILGIVEPEKKA